MSTPKYCPNCNHPIVTGPAADDLKAVLAWFARLHPTTQFGPARAADLYLIYRQVCPDLPPLTQRRFSAALLKAGWDFYRSTGGHRLYFPPTGFRFGPVQPAPASPAPAGEDSRAGAESVD